MAAHKKTAISLLLLERREITNELESIDQALRVLGYDGFGKKSQTRNANSSGRHPKKNSKAKKPSCTKQEVIGIVEGLLKDNGSLNRTDLEDLTTDKLKNELNRDLKGFAMRFREALGDSQVVEFESDNFRLASE